ncbi:uncharacterized protein ACLA_074320 [Aspergillus clavatus NRRL 1]|uniref:Secreted protein n=1 Tax=Aspergillus clavatus (strain ATCC 1007 / CBS 513.65 / DSM 816 / NCTC 3887 / NRRL 1 / QM 1276 / 107) TaxID=344612 RepID=A1C7M4_ASPCL|nr:uncharacterized protein ACLA_074320 [Aspergillus clavatus NRRL 1]EAW14395.1 conserved hypothetical protein [Aspergillus clavatus NRRL 1]
MPRSTLLAALSLLAPRALAEGQATPEPIAVPVPGGCSGLPLYDASTGIAGPWVIQTNQCTNTTAPGQPCTIEGYGDSVVMRYQSGVSGIYQGYVTIVPRNDLAKTPLRCNDATSSIEGRVPWGVSGVAWKTVNVSDMAWSAPLMWGLDAAFSRAVEPYHHYVNGVRQDGVFLGAGNVTRWGVKYYETSAGSWGWPYWMLRLLGPGSEDRATGEALKQGESTTFIRIYGS